MSRILSLAEDAISQIHSSKQITSLLGVVASLLENSLDAGANKAIIEVDFRRGACTVEDNGRGIPFREFEEAGGMGKMYHTSKRLNSSGDETHGSSGTFMASLSALSLVNITSRNESADGSATLIMHRGKVIARHLPSPPGYELGVHHGTKVVVWDLFGNMPVRTKQRALTGESGLEGERDWQALMSGIAALLLAWPRPCHVKLSDAASDKRSLALTSGPCLSMVALTEKSLNALHGQTMNHDLRDALPLLFQAGLAPHESRHQWVPLSASSGQLAVKGLICLDPAPTKHCQFVSIGIHPCSSGAGYSELYDIVNKSFANSSFGTSDEVDEVDEVEKNRRKQDRRYKNDGYTQKQLHGRKAVDRWPRFVLQVRIGGNNAAYGSSRTTSESMLKAILDILEATATQWLTAHHFRPRKRKARFNEDQSGPAAAQCPPNRVQTTVGLQSFLTSKNTAATPAKRAATAVGNLDHPKKRRVIDMSGNQAQFDSVTDSRPSSYFNSLSRIKYGQSHIRPKSASKSAATSPNKNRNLSAQPVPPARHPFALPSLAPGPLSVTKTDQPRTDTPKLIVEPTSVQTGPTVGPSSEDFGSFDDAALMDAVEQVEASVRDGPITADTGWLQNLPDAEEHDHGLVDDEMVEWKDPKTKQVYKVNARTGEVLAHRAPTATRSTSKHRTDHAQTSRPRAAMDTAVTSAGRPVRPTSRGLASAESVDSQWLNGFLKGWDNPVFKGQDEEQIPVALADGPGIGVNEAHEHRCSHHYLTERLSIGDCQGTSQLSKAMVQQSKVVAQVDAKFILCLTNRSNGQEQRRALVLVDQHAASERIILEQLLAELCSPTEPSTLEARFTTNLGYSSAVETVVLEKAIHFAVPERESEMFRRHAATFAAWGILFDLERPQPSVSRSDSRKKPQEQRLVVRALPPGIAERCMLLPNLLIDIMRAEIWSLAQSSTKPRLNKSIEESEPAWLRRIGSCPRGIIDMLNSRACRSAIMFNDVLSIHECEKLMEDLGRCAFPFFCAHGRVSMVPLVTLGQAAESALGDLGGRRTAVQDEAAEGPRGFAQAFRWWKGGDRDIAMQRDT